MQKNWKIDPLFIWFGLGCSQFSPPQIVILSIQGCGLKSFKGRALVDSNVSTNGQTRWHHFLKLSMLSLRCWTNLFWIVWKAYFVFFRSNIPYSCVMRRRRHYARAAAEMYSPVKTRQERRLLARASPILLLLFLSLLSCYQINSLLPKLNRFTDVIHLFFFHILVLFIFTISEIH